MKGRRGAWVHPTVPLLFAALALALLAPQANGQVEPAAPQPRQLSLENKPWKGDFEAMLTRRLIRVLVPYSRTLYFVDKGQPRGLAHDVFKLFEEDLNKHLKKGHVRVHVVFKPDARGDLIQSLQEGYGDVAMGYLTITPERRKEIVFTNPTARNVSEIVVTTAGQPPLSRDS